MDELRIGGRCQRHPLNILPCLKCAAEHPQSLTLRDVLRRLHAVIGDGTQKTAAEKLGVSQQYLSDVLNENREPGALILDALGLERVVSYRVAHGAPEPDDTAGVSALPTPKLCPGCAQYHGRNDCPVGWLAPAETYGVKGDGRG